MKWKHKAKIQNAISILPESVSYAAYYWVQRRYGGLRKINPVRRLTAGIQTWEKIQEQEQNPQGKVFLEVGTGRVPILPIAYWLMGAKRTITIDRNPYLKFELLNECLQYICDHKEEILLLFGSKVDTKRFDELLAFGKNKDSSSGLLDLCQIEYIAPGDASDTCLPDQSIDYHTSYAVYEHISEDVLKRILKEGNRIIKKDGLFINRIDYSDHFSHSDKSISAINFLQYTDDEWERLVGNRYMYMNRLRHDDFLKLFEYAGHKILDIKTSQDEVVREILGNGSLRLERKYRDKSDEILATTGAWIISKKKE
jgi:hypothetical protein